MVLLNPGPVNVSERVRKALLQPDMCHREPECAELIGNIRRKLLQAFVPGQLSANIPKEITRRFKAVLE